MKKIIKMFLVLASFACVFTGCAKQKKSNDAVSALKGRGQFVLGLDASFAPLGFVNDDNEIVGYDIDLGKEVAKRLGVKFVAQPINWDAKENELATGKIDCIWNGFTITDERKNQLSFTFAYLKNAQVLVVRKDSGIKSLADMKGKICGVQKGSSAQDAMTINKEFKSNLKEVVTFDDNVAALNDLEVRGLDGVVLDSVVANYLVTTQDKPFIVLDESLADEEYGIGFRKNEPELRDEVEKILLEMQNDGTIEYICQKWFGKNISVIGK